ncbi:MAG TPA: hypothetical protein VIG99_11875, partial [Myxococcaceae bacterium]
MVLVVLACTAPPGLGRPRVYAQYSDSIDEHCKYHPETCVGAFGPEAGTAAAATGAPVAATTAGPVTLDGAAAIGTGVLGASIIATAKLSQSEQAKIEAVLKQCADHAYSDVLENRFRGDTPSETECNDQVGLTARGEPLLFKMKLSEEMHQAAYRCIQGKLEALIPGRFSVEQRYRYNPRNGRTTLVTKEEEAYLWQHGAGDELRDSIVPDLVIHKGDPRYVQATYDFKFPCANRDKVPAWRRYPGKHPAVESPNPDQKLIYETILQKRA